MVQPPKFPMSLTSGLAKLDKEKIGLPTQIAYYSCLLGPKKKYEYEYQSHSALKRRSSFTFGKKPITDALKYPEWEEVSKTLDSLDSGPQLPWLEHIVRSCRAASRTKDLAKANVITTKGTLVDLAIGKEGRYDVLFVDEKLRIVRKSFKPRVIKNNDPGTVGKAFPPKFYGDCFEQLSTKEAEKPHGQFFSIVYREIGDLKVIMSGEVDCSSSEDKDKIPDMKDYIELKTLKKLQGKRFPEFYMQSHMLGVPVLHIGRRNSKDRVIRTEKKAPEQLFEDAKKRGKPFDPVMNMRRVYTILRGLLDHFEKSGVTAGGKVVLCVNAKGIAQVTSPSLPTQKGGRTPARPTRDA